MQARLLKCAQTDVSIVLTFNRMNELISEKMVNFLLHFAVCIIMAQRIDIGNFTFKKIEASFDVTHLYSQIDIFIEKSQRQSCDQIITDIINILKPPTETELNFYVRSLDKLVSRKIFPIVVVDEENNPIYVVSTEDRDEFDKRRQIFLYIKTHALLSKDIFEKLESIGISIYECILEIMTSIPIFINHLPFIETALEEHKLSHFMASILILGLRIEEILRSMLKCIGVDTLRTLPDGTVEEKSLGRIFYSIPETKKILDTDLYNYLLVLLIRKEGENLRNRLAHSLTGYKEFNKELSSLLIFTLLLLIDRVKNIDLNNC